MDMRRFLPIILIAFAALFILPQLFKGGGSKSLSTKNRGQLTLDAIQRIDRLEQKEFTSGGKYTDDLAQLAARDKILASELTIPLTVDLNVSGTGKSYLARVSSDIVSTVVSRTGPTVFRSCRVLKSRTGSTARPAQPSRRRPPSPRASVPPRPPGPRARSRRSRRSSDPRAALVGAPARAEPEAFDLHVPALRPPARVDERPRAPVPGGRPLAAATRAHQVRGACPGGRAAAVSLRMEEDAAAPALVSHQVTLRRPRARRRNSFFASERRRLSCLTARCSSSAWSFRQLS